MKNKILLLAVTLFMGMSAVACNNNKPSGDDDDHGNDNPSEETYTIVWKNYDDTVLETDENVAKGSTPSYDGVAPAKPEDEEFIYVWSGWDPTPVTVTADATYTAKFASVPKDGEDNPPQETFTIVWKNYNGAVLETDTNVEKGSTPSYDGATPTRPEDDNYTYTFSGWDPTPVAVTADATYTAKFDSRAKAPAHEHQFGNYVADGDYHYKVCSICGEKTTPEHHHGGHADCKNKAICEVCGAEYGDLDEHQFDNEWHYVDGDNYHYHECTVCHDRITAPHDFKYEIAKPECLVSAYDASCTGSNKYYKSCECGAHSHSLDDTFVINNSHDYSEKIVLENNANLIAPATCTTPAVYGYVCSHDHAHISAEKTFEYGEPKGHTYGNHVEREFSFCSFHEEHWQCPDCGRYFVSDGQGGYKEATYDEIFDNSKSQYGDPTYGTQENPYTIATKADILYLRKLVNAATTDSFKDKYIKLTSDIDFNFQEDEYFGAPIGYSDSKPFKGTFDGDGHKLIGLHIKGSKNAGEGELKGDNLALFSRTNGAVIKNLKLVDVKIDGDSSKNAGIVANAVATTVDNCEIISGTITGARGTGGIMGEVYYSPGETTIKNCINRANVTSIDDIYGVVGGILGGIVSQDNPGDDNDHFNAATTVLQNNVNYGTITADLVTKNGYAGGIVGLTRKFEQQNEVDVGSFTCTNCINYGDVHSVCDGVGGIVGCARVGSFDNCLSYRGANIVSKGKTVIISTLIGAQANGEGGYIVGRKESKATVGATGECKLCDSNGNDYIPSMNGNGTKESPYLICDVTDLVIFKNKVAGGDAFVGKYVALDSDIDLGQVAYGTAPIGNVGNAESERLFKGHFDGRNHTISNMTLSGDTAIAPFSNVANAEIKNVVFNNVSATASGQRAAGAVARLQDSVVENVHVTGTSPITGSRENGGVVGVAIGESTIRNCSSTASLSGSANTWNSIGGIVGLVFSSADLHAKANIINCTFSGSITSTFDGAAYNAFIGGIVGTATESTSNTFYRIVNCTNKGNITATNSKYVGGIIGLARKAITGSIVSLCNNEGDVIANQYVGGIAGAARTYLTACSSSMDATIGTSSNSGKANTLNATGGAAGTPGYINGTTEKADGTNLAVVSGCIINIEISSQAELEAYRDAVNAGTATYGAKLTNDISLVGAFTPIGTDEHKFEFVLDGNGHKITGLTINEANHAGLFSYVSGGGVKNLEVKDAVVSSSDADSKSAILIGDLEAGAVDSVVVSGTLDTKSFSGGIVGNVSGTSVTSTISNCVNNATITSNAEATGGIVGNVVTTARLTIFSCTNNGGITGTGNGNGTGGILGASGAANGSGSTIFLIVENCENKAAISGVSYVGGIVGLARHHSNAASKIINCRNYANITGSGSSAVSVGGIAGLSRINVENCGTLSTVAISLVIDENTTKTPADNELPPEGFGPSCGEIRNGVSGGNAKTGYILGGLGNYKTMSGCYLFDASGAVTTQYDTVVDVAP